jgi:hypothetical protein
MGSSEPEFTGGTRGSRNKNNTHQHTIKERNEVTLDKSLTRRSIADEIDSPGQPSLNRDTVPST